MVSDRPPVPSASPESSPAAPARASFEDRRAFPRKPSSARIRWSPADDGEVRIARFGDVSLGGARILTQVGPEVGKEVRFDVLGEGDDRVASGVARVAWARASEVGLSFIALGIDRTLVEVLAASPAVAPPPLPGSELARRGPPEGEPAVVDVSLLAEDVGGERLSATPDAPYQRPKLPIGIDLGTLCFRGAHVAEGHPQAIPLHGKHESAPSVVAFGPGATWTAGQRGEERSVTEPDAVVRRAKDLLGRDYGSVMGAAAAVRNVSLHETPEGDVDARVRGGHDVSPATAAARMLDHVRQAAESLLRAEVDGAVLTVPATFDVAQRMALLEAAAEAELPVIRLLSEPIAIAVAHAHKQPKPWARLGIWSMGASGLEFAVVSLRGGKLEIVALGQDGAAGAEAIDELLLGHLRAEIARDRPAWKVDAEWDARLRVQAESMKRALSSDNEALIEIRGPGGASEGSCVLLLTRPQFTDLIRPVLRRAAALATSVLDGARLSVDDIDEVVLAGSATRTPDVEATVTDLFHRRPIRRISPDRIVSFGAALVADAARSSHLPEIIEILPASLTVRHGAHVTPVLERGARLPCRGEVRVSADAVGNVCFVVEQGASDGLPPRYVASVSAADRTLWNGSSVLATLSLDVDGVLSVELRHASTGRSLAARVRRRRGDAPLGDSHTDPVAPP